jgi:hypothetical protein
MYSRHAGPAFAVVAVDMKGRQTGGRRSMPPLRRQLASNRTCCAEQIVDCRANQRERCAWRTAQKNASLRRKTDVTRRRVDVACATTNVCYNRVLDKFARRLHIGQVGGDPLVKNDTCLGKLAGCVSSTHGNQVPWDAQCTAGMMHLGSYVQYGTASNK